MGMVSKLKLEPCPLFLLGFLVCVIYIPGWIGASISTGWFLLMIAIPILLFWHSIPFTILHKIGIAFLAYAVLSLAWTPDFNIGLFRLAQLVTLGAIFSLGSSLWDLKPIFKGLAVGLGVSGIVGILQYYFDFSLIFTNGGNMAGLFVNQNVFCETSAVVLVGLLAFKLWRYVPLVIPSLFIVHSRAAMLALAIVGIIWLWDNFRTLSKFIIAILFVSIFYYVYSKGLNQSALQRFDLWEDTSRGLKLFGNGIGSYELLFPSHALLTNTELERPKYAHNDLLHLTYEVGIAALIFIPIIIHSILNRSNERMIIYAILIISCFSFPFHVPATAFIWFLVAGYLVRFHDTAWIVGIFRRPILFKRLEGKFS